MKKRLTVILCIVAVLLCVYVTGSGFMKRSDVQIVDFTVSDDQTQMLLRCAIPTSMGYIRSYTNNGGGVKPHYLTFYSTFGGLNSPMGARSTFTLELNADDSEIYVYRGNGGYELVLRKDAQTDQWNFTD